MEKLYSIDETGAEITLEKEVYPLVVIEKAISNFMEDVYIKIKTENENKVKTQLILKNKQQNKDKLEELIGEFYNELLRETLRYNISKETKNLRELIVGRALYTTCIEVDENDKETYTTDESTEQQNNEYLEDYNLDEIAVNWFERKN